MRDRKNMQPFIAEAEKANTVASTWVGDILAISTKGGMMKRPSTRGNIVDDVKKMNEICLYSKVVTIRDK